MTMATYKCQLTNANQTLDNTGNRRCVRSLWQHDTEEIVGGDDRHNSVARLQLGYLYPLHEVPYYLIAYSNWQQKECNV